MHDPVGQLLEGIELRRQQVSASLPAKHRAKLGQYFTPTGVADFLASLIELPSSGRFHLLDPGAGTGSLSASVVARVLREAPGIELHVTAFEIDEEVAAHLEASMIECVVAAQAVGAGVTYEVRRQSFIEYATGWLLEIPAQVDAVIMNPPYLKVSTHAPERVAAETRGLRASNLYTIFVGLAADLLVDGGQLSAIVPRSFANGPYHEPFRRFLLGRMSLNLAHVYERRGEVFGDADVLQENVILAARRAAQCPSIVISTSSGPNSEPTTRTVPAAEVLRPGDPHAFVRLPVGERDTAIADAHVGLPATLNDLEVSVSTGRVVDFRAREHLRADPGEDTVPLIYPGHVRDGAISWPSPGSKKPNALKDCPETARLLLPNETFVLAKRFSAKEERRRVSAAVCSPDDLPAGVSSVAVENHLNVFHHAHRGLEANLARGLCAYLNSTHVDDYVRTFSGHTQINATDLRGLRYPSAVQLRGLGAALGDGPWPEQSELDDVVEQHVLALAAPATVLARAA